MFKKIKINLASLTLGVLMAGCGSLAVTKVCEVVAEAVNADQTDDEWLGEESIGSNGKVSSQATVRITDINMADYIASRSNLSKNEALGALKAMKEGVAFYAKGGQPVYLEGFMAFKSVHHLERIGRNPKTGDPVTIPAYDSLEAKMLDTLKCQWNPTYPSCVGKTAADQQAAITAAINGLLYTSESDRPWAYSLNTTYTSFADFEAAQAGKTLETRKTLPQFFAQLSKPTGDPAGDALATRYKNLSTVWNKNFSSANRKVYWVKDPANPTEVHVFILGLNSFGMAILETISIET